MSFIGIDVERVRPEPRPLPDGALEALEALLTRRRQRVQMLTAERNRFLIARPATGAISCSTSATSSAGCGKRMTTCIPR